MNDDHKTGFIIYIVLYKFGNEQKTRFFFVQKDHWKYWNQTFHKISKIRNEIAQHSASDHRNK